MPTQAPVDQIHSSAGGV